MKKGLLSILFGTALVLGACGGGGDDGGTDNGNNGDTGTEESSGETVNQPLQRKKFSKITALPATEEIFLAELDLI